MSDLRHSCLYRCRSGAPSDRVYHVLNVSTSEIQDLTLPPGVVCNKCGEYFGHKLEQHFTKYHPASRQRLYRVHKTKSRKEPIFEDDAGRATRTTRHGESRFHFPFNRLEYATTEEGDIEFTGISDRPAYSSRLVSRLLAKITIECLYLNHSGGDLDPYAPRFDWLAEYARFDIGPFRLFGWERSSTPQQAPSIHRLPDVEDIRFGEVCEISFPGIVFVFPLAPTTVGTALRSRRSTLTVIEFDGMIEQEPQSLKLILRRVDR